MADNAGAISQVVDEEDIVIVHDPQPAGLIPALRERSAAVIWRCHVGVDEPNHRAREAWDFLSPYLADVDAYVFSHDAFVWEGLDRDRVFLIEPAIDVFTPKNQELEPERVEAILRAVGLIEGAERGSVTFERHDGTEGRVEGKVELVEDQPLSGHDPLVLQVSRWDALKDPLGVIQGFAEHVPAATGAHLLYAGPAVEAVTDDPEGKEILRSAIAARERLPEELRARVHLATVGMDDPDENAIIVNALQRHARVVTQKSIAEGFGLTVAEAMWKSRPVVASKTGGIQDQIADGESGVLLDDPRDLAAFGAAITDLLGDPPRAQRMGRAAHERVRDEFLSLRSLVDYLELIGKLLPAD
jgi:trehalose synthase